MTKITSEIKKEEFRMTKNFVALALAVALSLVSFSANAATCNDIPANFTMQSSEETTTITVAFYSEDNVRPEFYNNDVIVPKWCRTYHNLGIAADKSYYTFPVEDGKILIIAKSDRCTWTLPSLPEGDDPVEVKGKKK